MRPVSSRRILALTSALMFFYGVYLGGMQTVISDVAETFQAGITGMGALVSTQHAAAVFMPVWMGMLADRLGKKPVLTAFSLIFGMGCAVCAFADGMVVYGAGLLLVGGGYSVCESLSCAVLADLDAQKSARFINLTQCLLCVGAVISPILVRVGMAELHMSWRSLFRVCAAAFALLAFPIARTEFPLSGRHAHREPRERAGAARLFSSGVFVRLFLAILLYVGLENGFGYFVDSLFEARFAVSGAAAVSLYWAGMAICRMLCSLRRMDARRALIVCFALAAALFVALTLSRASWLSVLLCAVVGAAYGPIWSTLVAEAAARFPQHSASATGMMSSASGMGGVFYPILMGAVAEHFSLDTAFLMLAGTAALGGALCMRLPRQEKSA